MSKKQYLLILALAVIAITLCSQCSPIYAFNDGYDINCFMTIGRGMLEGKLPYRDMFDHKGPLVYVLYAFANLISRDSFIGVYFIEIFFAFLFLVNVYKICEKYKSKNSFLLTAITAIITYTSITIWTGGGAVEEYFLSFLSYAVLLAVRNKVPTGNEFFLIGITSGIIFWSKYSVLFFYVVWMFYVIWPLFKEKNWKNIFYAFFKVSQGVIAVSLVVLCFSNWLGITRDMFDVYFIKNIRDYDNNSTRLGNLFGGILSFISYDSRIILLLLFACIFTYKKREFWFVLIAIITWLLSLHMRMSFCYYDLVFVVFIPLGLLLINFKDIFNLKNWIILGLSGLLCIILTPNKYMLEYKKEDLPQYKFAEIIKQSDDQSLLNYFFLDGGFYMALDQVPDNKYFYWSNLPLAEKREEQHGMVNEGTVEWVVINLGRIPEETDFSKYDGVEIACSNVNYTESCFGLLRRVHER